MKTVNIPNEPHKAVLWTAVGATVVIAVGAFILSFAALTDLAMRSGIEDHLAWIWPIIVDGMIVAATVAIVALNGHERRALVYPWSLLFFGAIVSTAANSVHAILTVEASQSGIPPLVSALVAAMPPVVLLAITHLTVHMYQKRAEAAALRDERDARLADAQAEADAALAADRAELDAQYRDYYEARLEEQVRQMQARWTEAEQVDPAAAAAEGLEPAFEQPADDAGVNRPERPSPSIPDHQPGRGAKAPLYDDTWQRIAPGTPAPRGND